MLTHLGGAGRAQQLAILSGHERTALASELAVDDLVIGAAARLES